MEDFLRVGVITQTHGIKGEVKVFPTTDDVKRFEELKSVKISTKKGYIDFEIENVKFFKKYAILKFKGINDINEAEKYKGLDLLIAREDAVKLRENEYFIYDLIGLKVINNDTNEEIGILNEVLQTGANDVYVIRTDDGKEILIPYIKECVLDIDIENKIMIVHLLDGLV